jgi:hypothetical protein
MPRRADAAFRQISEKHAPAMSISLADLNWLAWPLWTNFMGLKAVDASIEQASDELVGVSRVFSR